MKPALKRDHKRFMLFVDGIKLDLIRSEQKRGVRRGVSFMRFEEGMAMNYVVLCMKANLLHMVTKILHIFMDDEDSVM